jgi:L-ascorbate metabolism protein UlaG (beta-lactamase superfamily)
MKILAAAAATVAGGALLLRPRTSNAYYAGPISDHFDGLTFFNPGQQPTTRGFHHFLAMRFREEWSTWPERFETLPADVPPPRVDGARARIAFIGHASWLIQASGLNILVDPVWSERASPVSFAGPRRANPPGILFDALPRIDVVLVTHNHYDHLDAATLARLWARDKPRIVTPLGNDTIIASEASGATATAVDWHQSVELSPTMRLHVVPTWHWSGRGLRDRRHALWASFVLDTPVGRIYAVGDTGFGDGNTFRHVRARFGDIKLALLPIGAYEPRWFMNIHHMDPAEAVAAFDLCGAKAALGHHWGTFQLTAEPHDAPAVALAAALDAQSIPRERFPAVRPGHVQTLGA